MLLFPSSAIFSGKITVPAGERDGKEIFSITAASQRIDSEVVPLQATLNAFTTSRDADLMIQFFDGMDPIGPQINTNGLPGLNQHVSPVNLIVHVDHTLYCKAFSKSNIDKDLIYCFHFERTYEEERDIRQWIIAGSPTLAAYEAEYKMAEFIISRGRILDLYQLGLARNGNIVVYFRRDGVAIEPVDGIQCGASRDIDWPHKVDFAVDGDEFSKLLITCTNLSAASQEFPFRLLALDIPKAQAMEYGIKVPGAKGDPGAERRQ